MEEGLVWIWFCYTSCYNKINTVADCDWGEKLHFMRAWRERLICDVPHAKGGYMEKGLAWFYCSFTLCCRKQTQACEAPEVMKGALGVWCITCQGWGSKRRRGWFDFGCSYTLCGRKRKDGRAGQVMKGALGLWCITCQPRGEMEMREGVSLISLQKHFACEGNLQVLRSAWFVMHYMPTLSLDGRRRQRRGLFDVVDVEGSSTSSGNQGSAWFVMHNMYKAGRVGLIFVTELHTWCWMKGALG